MMGMELIQNMIEYYEELYPVTDEQKKFYSKEIEKYQTPAKVLRIGCGTGQFENYLAKKGLDVTGLETSRELLDSANRRRRTQLMAIRFFQMSTIEMSRFLGKGFYDIISCLNDRILFIHDETLMKKFFFDCKQLLAPGGELIIQMTNFNHISRAPVVQLSVRESIRAKLFTDIISEENGGIYLKQYVETGNGKLLPVIEKAAIYPLIKEEIEEFAKNAGFKEVSFYGDYNLSPLTDDCENLVCIAK